MKILIALFMVLSSLYASSVKMPQSTFRADGAVTDIVYKNAKLYVSTTAGMVDVFDTKTKKIITKIEVPKIKDFMGRESKAKIYSVDFYKGDILLLSQAQRGYRELFLYKNNELKKLIGVDEKLSIAKAKFIDEETVVFALLSNDIISYNIKTKKQNWTIQASMSKFSDFVLSEDKSQVVVADESGELHMFHAKNGELFKTLEGQNLDNVFNIDYKKQKIITAGQDRRAVVYDLSFNSAYYKTSHFLIYSAALSPSAKLGAFASDEQNNVTVFKTNTKSTVGVFGGNEMTLVKILFINENEFFVASDANTINLYKIK
jgi:WD40 repeat protein